MLHYWVQIKTAQWTIGCLNHSGYPYNMYKRPVAHQQDTETKQNPSLLPAFKDHHYIFIITRRQAHRPQIMPYPTWISDGTRIFILDGHLFTIWPQSRLLPFCNPTYTLPMMMNTFFILAEPISSWVSVFVCASVTETESDSSLLYGSLVWVMLFNEMGIIFWG